MCRSSHRSWPGLLLLAALALPLAAGSLHAQLPATPAAPSPAIADTHDSADLYNSLRDVINYGAELFNKHADHAGCYRVYQGALISIRPFMAPEVRKKIDESIVRAEALPFPADRAFELRKIMDDIRTRATPNKSQPAGIASASATKPSTPPSPAPVKVGRIIVVGNKTVKDDVIRKVIGILPGQSLNAADLRVAEKNLERLGVFELKPELGIRPTVTVQRTDDANVQDIVVQVSEAPVGAVDLPKPNTPKVDVPKLDLPRITDLPKNDPPKVDLPKVDLPKVDKPKVDLPKVDPPKIDLPSIDPPKVDKPKVDVPRVDPPKLDLPKVDPPKVDLPKVDPPKVDLPKVDLPQIDLPKVDLPKPDSKKPETPTPVDPLKIELPKVDPPKVDLPKGDNKKSETPKPVDPLKIELPKVDPPKVDVPKIDVPKIDVPKVAPPTDPLRIEPPTIDPPKKTSATELPRIVPPPDAGKQSMVPARITDEAMTGLVFVVAAGQSTVDLQLSK